MPRNRSEREPTVEGAPAFALDILRAEIADYTRVRALWDGGSINDRQAYQDLGPITRLKFRRDYAKWLKETKTSAEG